ncbi:MAG: hypothetical protein KAR44_04040 [Candidatus Aegiribacteria sp.]|nr:hypothetical protein [Candidatus Aegiribacteria sp.]
MNIWDINKLVLFIAFFVPGFISIKTYDLLVPSAIRSSGQTIIEAITYSAINYALFSWILLIKNLHPILIAIIAIIILLISPILLACGYWRFRNSGIVKKHSRHPIPKPWDYVFGKQKSYWVIIEYTDGDCIGGIYDTDSFTSSYPLTEQIYLQEEWEIEGRSFIKPIDRSSGILISDKDIRAIRFYS